MNNKKDFKVGDFAEIEHLVKESDIEKFVALSGDDNRMHLEDQYAIDKGFKGRFAHGMLGASFISTVIGTKLPGDGAVWISQSFDFLNPVSIGDKLRIKVEVVKSHPSQNILELSTDVFNQLKQKVISGIAKVQIPQSIAKEQSLSNSTDNKLALVIGGSGGIGSAAALNLAGKGFNIIIHYNKDENKANKLVEQIKKLGVEARAIKANISKRTEVKEMFSEIKRYFKGISILINCASPPISNIKFDELAWDDFHQNIGINIKGTFNLFKECLPFMKEQKYGRVVLVSTQATDSITSGWSHYITAKSGLEGFGRTIAKEYAPFGISVNIVSPGMTKTDFISSIPQRARLLTEASTPVKRLADPDEIAEIISFLASESSSYITGETIRVNGGNIMK